MPLSRLVFPFSKNLSEASFNIFRRLGVSKRFSSSICTSTTQSSVCHCPISGPSLTRNPRSYSWFKKFDSSKRCYSSSTKSTSNKMHHLPVHEGSEQAVNSVSWSYFTIPASVLAGVGGLVFFIHKNDEKRAVPKADGGQSTTAKDFIEIVKSIARVSFFDFVPIYASLGQGEKFERSAIQGPIIGGPFSLINTERQLVTEKNLLGNWVLLNFGYTSSPDVGPAEVQKMAKSVDILESKQNLKVLPVFVTIDPQRDTPAQLCAYIREFDSRIVGLTGPVAAIRQMAQEYRVFFKKIDEEGDDYLVESSHNMYLLNPDMVVVRSFGVEYSAEELAEAITNDLRKNQTTIQHH